MNHILIFIRIASWRKEHDPPSHPAICVIFIFLKKSIVFRKQFWMKNPLRKNVNRLLVCVPFSLGSICKCWIYLIDDIGVFTTLSNIYNGAFCEKKITLPVCYYEKIVFIVLPIIWNQSKTKKFRTLFLRHSLTTIFDTELKRFQGGFFELEMLKIFTRAFFIKNHYWTLKLSIVALPSDIIVLLKNEKKIIKTL